MQRMNSLFYSAHKMEMHMAELFYQMKCIELSNKFVLIKEIGNK